MKILLTNDDGIQADGLFHLQQALKDAEIHVVAPAEHVSECSHRITTRMPIRVEARGQRRWAVHGSPADCVRVAIKYLYPKIHFDWVVAGINEGGNLGVDIFYSGTVAAVREATLHGYRGMAFSHYMRRDLPRDWDAASLRARRAFEYLSDQPLEALSFWNINLPHLESQAPEPEIRSCKPCLLPLPVGYEASDADLIYRGSYADRPRSKDSDTEWCFGGGISISKIQL